jgi:hypothetical protein
MTGVHAVVSCIPTLNSAQRKAQLALQLVQV